MTIIPVILSGGIGSRLWPASRTAHPKQLHALVSERTMLQETLVRTRDALAQSGSTADEPIIVCNARHAGEIERQLDAIGVGQHRAITEPVGRNTAPAAALAALLAAEQDPEAVLIILPADHHIVDSEAYRQAVDRAVALAQAGKVVTYGIVPHTPETGYGYIRRGDGIGDGGQSFVVAEFVEKPSRDIAEQYVSSGQYFWNGGIFTVRTDTLLNEMAAHCADILDCCRQAMDAASRTNRLVMPDPAIFAGCRSDSIDYAVMEHTDKAAVVSADMGWSDVGSWTAIHDIADTDANGNSFSGDVLAVDAEGSLVRSESRLVAVAGIRDLVVVETADAVLVTTREKAQNVKDIVSELTKKDRSEI
ncbi:MAG: mannose-1-phosphate guanylyltransferase/mannose-6-phosphate isomerase [Alphaproteobacteria bacterium]